ncbi:MAG: cupin domain-containing protein [Candidatus Omnitrophota bacterium]
MSEPKVIKLEGKEGYQRLLGGSPDTFGMKSGSVTLKAGESVGEHSTDEKEEAIVVLQGKAEISCDQKDPITAEKGTLVYIPPNTKHDVKNAGEDALRYIYVVSPINMM